MDNGKVNVDDGYLCYLCGKMLVHNSGLVKHMKLVHNVAKSKLEISLSDGEEEDESVQLGLDSSYLCTYCGKLFMNNLSLVKHMVNIHKETIQQTEVISHESEESNSAIRPSLNLLCSYCVKPFANNSSLVRHLKNIHYDTNPRRICPDEPDCVQVEFQSLSEFFKWKEDMEKQTNSSYVKARGLVHRGHGCVHMYYDCCRTGVYQPNGKGIRKVKQPSIKINGKCPAKINVRIKDNSIFVKHYPRHRHSVKVNKPKDIGFAKAGKLLSVRRPDTGLTGGNGNDIQDFVKTEEVEIMDVFDFEDQEHDTDMRVSDTNGMQEIVESVVKVETNVTSKLSKGMTGAVRDDIKIEYVKPFEETETMEDASVQRVVEIPGREVIHDTVESMKEIEVVENTDAEIPEIAKYEGSIREGALMFVTLYQKNKANLSIEDTEQLHKHLDSMINIVSNKLNYGQTAENNNKINSRLICLTKKKNKKVFILGKQPLEGPTSDETSVINLLRSSVGLSPMA